MNGIISGGRGPVIPSLLQNKKAGGVKVNTVTGLGPGYIIPGPWPEFTHWPYDLGRSPPLLL